MSLLKTLLLLTESTSKLLPLSIRNKSPLYHATELESLYSILSKNILYGSDDYDFGVATSRNRRYLFFIDDYGNIHSGKAECQLILDREKITNTYKIKPFDWEEYKQNKDQNYHQSEDKIYTNEIKNIKKYLLGIHINVEDKDKQIYHKIKSMIDDTFILIFDKNWNVIKS